MSLIHDYVPQCDVHVLGVAAEVPPGIYHDLDGGDGSLELAVHLVGEKVESLVVAELLPPRVLALRYVLVDEAFDYVAHVSEEHEALLALHAHLHLGDLDLRIVEELRQLLIVVVLHFVAVEDLVVDFRLEELRVQVRVQEPRDHREFYLDVPGLREGGQQVALVQGQVVALIAVDGRLEGREELRRQVVLGLVQLLHQLVDRGEV